MVLQGIDLALAVGLIPTASMIMCSILATKFKVSPELEAIFQNFAAGLILAAVAAELFPLLKTNPNTNEEISQSDQTTGISLGFFISLLLIYGIEYVMEKFEEEDDDEEESDEPRHSHEHDGKENDTDGHANRNTEYYKKVAEEQGMELDEKNRIVKPRSNTATSDDSTGSQTKHKSSPGKNDNGDIELGDLYSRKSSIDQPNPIHPDDDTNSDTCSASPTDEHMPFASEDPDENEADGFIGYGVGGVNTEEWDDRGIEQASRAISDPKHRAHVLEHIQELVEAVKALEVKSNKITDGVTQTKDGHEVQVLLPLKVSDELAEEMDMGVHNLQYLIDHCRRLLQGTEFEFETDADNNTPILFNRMDEKKKALMKRRVRVLRYTAEHLLDHVKEGEKITPNVLKEVFMHMNEMDKHLEFFHDSVEKVATRWTKRHQLPMPETGDFLPVSLIVPVTIDCFTDGFLIGVACSLKAQAGVILALANTLEMGFLGIAYSCRLAKCTGSSVLSRQIALYTPPLIMYASASIGALAAQSTSDQPAVFVGFVSFGVVALLYLVCNELLIEAREAQGEDGKWWISIWIFIAVWLVLVTSPFFDE